MCEIFQRHFILNPELSISNLINLKAFAKFIITSALQALNDCKKILIKNEGVSIMLDANTGVCRIYENPNID